MTDSIRRDDLRTSETAKFDALEAPMQKALVRATYRVGVAFLPHPMEDNEGWLMVPTRKGLVQVAYKGVRASRI